MRWEWNICQHSRPHSFGWRSNCHPLPLGVYGHPDCTEHSLQYWLVCFSLLKWYLHTTQKPAEYMGFRTLLFWRRLSRSRIFRLCDREDGLAAMTALAASHSSKRKEERNPQWNQQTGQWMKVHVAYSTWNVWTQMFCVHAHRSTQRTNISQVQIR